MNAPIAPPRDAIAIDQVDADAWLEIVDGRQRGARAPLTARRTCTLGSGDGNDFRLLDDSVACRHLSITLDGDRVELTALDEMCRMGDRVLERGQTTGIAIGESWQAGERTLRCLRDPGSRPNAFVESPVGRSDAVGSTGRASTHDSRIATGEDDSVETNRIGTNTVGTSPTPPTRRKSSAPSPNRVTRRWRAAVLLAGAAIAACTLYLGLDDDPLARDPGATVRSAVDALELDGVLVDATVRPVLVHGFVRTQAEALAVDAALGTTSAPVATRLIVGERVASRIADVLRVNGVDADVTVSEANRIRATTLGVSPEDWKRAWSAVLRDVPRIRDMKIIRTNEPATAREERREDDPVRFDPDKQVALVVSEPPAHIVTHDRSRYFVGSLLPSGHRIISIEHNLVALRKRDAVTTLQF